MRRFTVFTFLYLATGICLSAIALHKPLGLIAFGQPDSTPSLKKIMLVNAGMLYLFAVLSTFRFWQQSILNSKNRLGEQHTWRQKLSPIAPWLIIAVTLGSFIFALLTNQQMTDVIAQAVSELTLILLCVEWLFTKHPIQS